jgi:HD-like signal output (HDOD) protein
MIDENAFLETLNQAIDSNRLTLPTLPEVAIQVRNAVESEKSTAKEVADIITTDTALSARLLQVANSPLYRGRVQIESVQMAVTRLGVRLVRSLVVSLIMQQIFQATHDLLDMKFRQVWEESVQIAGLSRVLASFVDQLDKDQAMLGGLIHNIGALPVLAMAEAYDELLEDADELDRVIMALSPTVGSRILKMWDFPDSLINVTQHFQDLNYRSEGEMADYADVVLVARQQALVGKPNSVPITEWANIPAFQKVGVEPEINIIEVEGVADDLESIEVMFLS